MSSRIKRTKGKNDTEARSPSAQHDHESLVKRKRTRRADSDDEPALDGRKYLTTASQRKERMERQLKRSRTDEDMDEDVDVEGGVEEETGSIAVDERFLPDPPTQASASSSKSRRSVVPDGHPSKKKRNVVYSDGEESDEYKLEETERHSPARSTFDDDNDDDLEQHTNPRRGSKSKGKVKPRGGVKGKGKGKEAQVPIAMKDERKLTIRLGKSRAGSQESTSTAGMKRSRPAELHVDIEEESVVDVVGRGGSISATPEPSTALDLFPASEALPTHRTISPAKDKEADPPPLKKRKLPTIKKNKVPGSTTISTPSSSKPPLAGVSKGVHNVDDASKALPLPLPLPVSTPVSIRKPAATIGSADFDLRNASVYAELFKAGGTTPRSGLNRREKDEERRRDLYRMRDEARAKRDLDGRNAFDLLGQVNKITRFEERFRSERSLVLYPNYLGAKWRHDWDQERRKEAGEEPSDTNVNDHGHSQS